MKGLPKNGTGAGRIPALASLVPSHAVVASATAEETEETECREEAMDDGERGAVTAEFAVALPAVIALLALLLGGIATGVTQLQLEESARVGARAATRGEPAETVQRVSVQADPTVTVEVSQRGDLAVVRTSRQAPGIVGKATGWVLVAEAAVPREEL